MPPVQSRPVRGTFNPGQRVYFVPRNADTGENLIPCGGRVCGVTEEDQVIVAVPPALGLGAAVIVLGSIRTSSIGY